MKKWMSMLNTINDSEEIVIYGAGLMGRNLLHVLTGDPYKKSIACFIVKNKEGNPDHISGVKVLSINEAYEYTHVLILVALHEKYINSALYDLENSGFDKLIPVSFDSDVWSELRKEWLLRNDLLPYGTYLLNDAEDNHEFSVYVVHSESDKKLIENMEDKEYEIPIQVGAANATNIIYSVRDNEGDNISDKNRQYCELTALYWVWKHSKSKYIGLSHYRRRFELKNSEILGMLSGNVDIIVTVPILNLDTVKGQYIKDHDKEDWDIMRNAIWTLCPEYLGVVDKVGDGFFYFAYNMFITSKSILNAYCTWLFPILEYCEKKIGQKNDVYQNRYVGFLAERLLTVYIVYHQELKVIITDKYFVETKVL